MGSHVAPSLANVTHPAGDIRKVPLLTLVIPPQIGLLRGFTTGLACIADYVTRHLPQAQPIIVDLNDIGTSALKNLLEGCTFGTSAFDFNIRLGHALLAAGVLTDVRDSREQVRFLREGVPHQTDPDGQTELTGRAIQENVEHHFLSPPSA